MDDDEEQRQTLDEAQIQRAARLILDRTEQQRAEVDQLGRPNAGSPLAGDDRTAHPHKVSQAAVRALHAATEHLDALRALLLQARLMHPTAPYTLIRAAIETGSTAVWLLVPTTRPERVTRSLRLTVRDAIDAATVSAEKSMPMRRSLQERRSEIDQLAQAVNGGRVSGRLEPANSTGIVRAADAVSTSPVGVLTPWRVCSGFAHGRLWSTLAILPREVVDLDVPGDVGLRVTNSLDRLIWATMAAVDVINIGLDLYRTRAGSPYAPR